MLIPTEAIAGFHGPAVLIVGAHDPIFDSEATVAAARKGLSGLREFIWPPDEGHIFGPAGDEVVRDTAAELFERPAG